MKYFVVGIVCLVIALIFGLFNVVIVDNFNPSSSQAVMTTPNVTSAGASCGFAIAGGLCLIASALTCRDKSKE